MLVSLHVKNLALIKECEVLFGKGLNILTGETGAGKSVIIGSVRYALGEKADKDCIRTGADYALIELVFSSEKQEVTEKLQELMLPVESDGTILIQRKIMMGRSICKINGETISSRQLKDIASLLLDIHGQNDTQTLLNVRNQSQILDEYAGSALTDIKEKMKEGFQGYSALKKELQDAKNHDALKEKEISLAEFEINEIEAANLQPGEDEALEASYQKMNHAKKIAEAVAKAGQATGYDSENGAGEAVSFALREIKAVSALDEELLNMEEKLSQIEEMLGDFNREASDYLSGLEFSQEEYLQVENRLNTCNHLKNKYGATIDEVLQYLTRQKEKIEQYADYEGYLSKLHEKYKTAENKVMQYAKEASAIRKKSALLLAEELEKALMDLSFQDVAISIEVTTDENTLTENGYDETEFMISLNAGEPKKPLNYVASGGELSRIMLALKTIMADKENTQTMIFDEIDSGISGKTAWQVSQKMAVLGKEHQLICITHLPQIAAMADSHFVIEKVATEAETETVIHEIKNDESIHEIARLLGSDSLTPAVLANAKELKEMANHTKRY